MWTSTMSIPDSKWFIIYIYICNMLTCYPLTIAWLHPQEQHRYYVSFRFLFFNHSQKPWARTLWLIHPEKEGHAWAAKSQSFPHPMGIQLSYLHKYQILQSSKPHGSHYFLTTDQGSIPRRPKFSLREPVQRSPRYDSTKHLGMMPLKRNWGYNPVICKYITPITNQWYIILWLSEYMGQHHFGGTLSNQLTRMGDPPSSLFLVTSNLPLPR